MIASSSSSSSSSFMIGGKVRVLVVILVLLGTNVMTYLLTLQWNHGLSLAMHNTTTITTTAKYNNNNITTTRTTAVTDSTRIYSDTDVTDASTSSSSSFSSSSSSSPPKNASTITSLHDDEWTRLDQDAIQQLVLHDDDHNASTMPAPAPVLLAESPGFMLLHNKNEKAPLALVTAFSESFFTNALYLLQNLQEVQYQGPLIIYIIRKQQSTQQQQHKPLPSTLQPFLEKMNATQLLNVQVWEHVEDQDFFTYCFKPKVIHQFLAKYATNVDTFLWTDTSTIFYEDPTLFGQRVLQDKVGIVTHEGKMGMYENTHPDTYRYLNISRTKYIDQIETSANQFIMNLHIPGVLSQVLMPWMQCGMDACLSCMAPPGSTKAGGKGYQGAGGTTYLAHRQDQSVLSLLDLEYNASAFAAAAANNKNNNNAQDNNHNNNNVTYFIMSNDQNAQYYLNATKNKGGRGRVRPTIQDIL